MARFRFGAHLYDTETRALTRQGTDPVTLKPKNGDVLEVLLRGRDGVVTRDQLFDAVWGEVVVTEQALNKVINELRACLNDSPRRSAFIKTYTKKGYGWIYPDTEEVPRDPPAAPLSDPSAEAVPAQSPTTEPPAPEAAPDTPARTAGPPPQTEAVSRPQRRTRGLLPAALLLAAVVCLTLWMRPSAADTDSGAPYIAVMPMVNLTGQEENGWVASGLRDLVLQTVEEQGVFTALDDGDLKKALKQADLAPDTPPTPEDYARIGRLLSCKFLVWASLQQADQGFRLQYRVLGDGVLKDHDIAAESLLKAGNLLAYNLLELGGYQGDPGARPKLSRDDFIGETYAKGLEFMERRDLDKAVNHFEVCLDNDPGMTWAQLHLARAHRLLGNREQAADLFSRVYEKSQIEKNPILEAQSLRYLGLLSLHKGEWEKALSFSHRCLAIYQNLGDEQGEILAGNQIATLLARMQKLDEAEAILQKNRQLVRGLGNRYLMAGTAIKLATVQSMRGDIEAAETGYFEALEVVRALEDRRNEASILENLGNISYMRKGYDRAEAYYRQALQLHVEDDNTRGRASALHNLGVTATAVGDYPTAETHLAAARALAGEIEDHYLENQIAHNLGANALHAGDLNLAEKRLTEAVDTALRQANDGLYLDSAGLLAHIYVVRGRYDQAIGWLDKIEAQARELPTWFAVRALLEFQRGRWDLAVAHQERARTLAGRTWSQRDEKRLNVYKTAMAQQRAVPLVDPDHVPLF